MKLLASTEMWRGSGVEWGGGGDLREESQKMSTREMIRRKNVEIRVKEERENDGS